MVNSSTPAEVKKPPGCIQYFNEPRLSDLVVRLVESNPVSDSTSEHERTRDVHVSKLILATASEYFRVCCMTDVGATATDTHNTELCPDAPVSSAKRRKVEGPTDGVLRLVVPTQQIGVELLRFTYVGNVPQTLADPLDLVLLAVCADKYQVAGVLETVVGRLETMTENEEACRIILSNLPSSLIETHPQMDDLIRSCAKFIVKSFYSSMLEVQENTDKFLKEPFQVVETIICDDDFVAGSEENLVHYVIQWAQVNITNEADLEQWLRKVTPHVRFGTMSFSYLSALSKIPSFKDATFIANSRNLGSPFLHTFTDEGLAGSKFFVERSRSARIENQVYIYVKASAISKRIMWCADRGLRICSLGKRFFGDVKVVQGFRFRLEVGWCGMHCELQLSLKRLPLEGDTPLDNLFNSERTLVTSSVYNEEREDYESQRTEFIECSGSAKARVVLGPFPEDTSPEDMVETLERQGDEELNFWMDVTVL
eukprot:TRINITY_DN1896_c0_g1_i1.p1 TRINITY_DN1896_c0_g1~~TRINITY_DN1896_c0_g1_i1.p1  ORF type:complete len:483 (+),score=42.88 TRINITY_DN1896_c0_g1_i1:1262-2710(+)